MCIRDRVIINADHMAALPELKYIGVLATGYNVVDTAAAKERGIDVYKRQAGIICALRFYCSCFPVSWQHSSIYPATCWFFLDTERVWK